MHNIENLSCEKAYKEGMKEAARRFSNLDLIIRLREEIRLNHHDQLIEIFWNEIAKRLDVN